jgi:hypothetical protein
VDIDGAIVLNNGTIGAYDIGANTCYRILRDGTVTVFPNRVVAWTPPHYSILKKYIMIGNLAGAGNTVEIWRNGFLTWTHNVLPDSPPAVLAIQGDLSADGRYFVCVLEVIAANTRYVALYEGRP